MNKIVVFVGEKKTHKDEQMLRYANSKWFEEEQITNIKFIHGQDEDDVHIQISPEELNKIVEGNKEKTVYLFTNFWMGDNEKEFLKIFEKIVSQDNKMAITEQTIEHLSSDNEWIEKYCKIKEVRTNYDIQEKSCGCIVIKDGKVLLVQHNQGHWGFPKGHVEQGEDELTTAMRETKEETNIDVKPDPYKRYTEYYTTNKGNHKEVVYFIASPIDDILVKQDEEIQNIGYFTPKEALETITFEGSKDILKKIFDL